MVLAPEPWCERPGARATRRPIERGGELRLQEISGANAVLPHLEMKRLVIGPESPGCFALVAARCLQRPPDRPPLSLGGGLARHLLQRQLGRRKGGDVSGRRLDGEGRWQ